MDWTLVSIAVITAATFVWYTIYSSKIDNPKEKIEKRVQELDEQFELLSDLVRGLNMNQDNLSTELVDMQSKVNALHMSRMGGNRYNGED